METDGRAAGALLPQLSPLCYELLTYYESTVRGQQLSPSLIIKQACSSGAGSAAGCVFIILTLNVLNSSLHFAT